MVASQKYFWGFVFADLVFDIVSESPCAPPVGETNTFQMLRQPLSDGTIIQMNESKPRKVGLVPKKKKLQLPTAAK